MRRIMRWVYYCDHCKKSLRSGGGMKKHELHCCANPDRECRMCKRLELVQLSATELVQLAEEKTFPEFQREVECPACTLSALLLWRKKYSDELEYPSELPREDWSDWDFKAEMKKANTLAFENDQQWAPGY